MRPNALNSQDINVLVLDDSEGMRRLISSMLVGRVKGRLYLCATTLDAAEMLESERFHVALIDRELGREDGLEYIRQIRTRPGPHQTMPIVAMTVNASREILLEALMSGANSVIRKPASTRALGAHITQAVTVKARYVPFGPHVVPFAPPLSTYVGDNPSPQRIIETLAGAVYRPAELIESIAASSPAAVRPAFAPDAASTDAFMLI